MTISKKFPKSSDTETTRTKRHPNEPTTHTQKKNTHTHNQTTNNPKTQKLLIPYLEGLWTKVSEIVLFWVCFVFLVGFGVVGVSALLVFFVFGCFGFFGSPHLNYGLSLSLSLRFSLWGSLSALIVPIVILNQSVLEICRTQIQKDRSNKSETSCGLYGIYRYLQHFLHTCAL